MALRAREKVFDLHRSIGAVQTNGFGPSDDPGTNVLVHGAAARRLANRLGAEAAWALLTLCTLADETADGRLVVQGGAERLRAELAWGKDKAQRVVRLLCDAGFALREQQSARSHSGQPRFGATLLFLELGTPSALEDTAPARTCRPGTRAPVATPPPTCSSGHRAGAGVAEVAGAGVAGSGEAGAGVAGAFAEEVQRYTSEDAHGVPVRSVAGSSGSGECGSAHDHEVDDEQDHSSTSSRANAGASDPVRTLEALGFHDGPAIVERHGTELVLQALAYVMGRGDITNRGAYLRQLLRTGRVPKPPATPGPTPPPRHREADPERGLPIPVGLRPAPGASPGRQDAEGRVSGSHADELLAASDGDPSRSACAAPLGEVEAVLDRLPTAQRDAVLAAVDAELQTGPFGRRAAWLQRLHRTSLLERHLSEGGYLNDAIRAGVS